MKGKKIVHIVLLKAKLNYDGRVFSLLNTIASAYSNDEIIAYNYDKGENKKIEVQKNTKIIYFKSLFEKFNRFKIFRALRLIEYSINSFLMLLYYRPKSIQLHHEVVLISALLYKLFFRKTILVYDDKEFYHFKDKNISCFFYFIEKITIQWSDLIIVANEYRRKAIFKLNKNKIKSCIIVDNYEFNNKFSRNINIELKTQLEFLKGDNTKILLHQGIISKERGAEKLVSIIESLPFNWKLCFIGVSNDDFKDFTINLNNIQKDKIRNLGYIDYNELSDFYKYVDGAILFYDALTFNNKYCAPNRLYSAANNGVPIIVNIENFTLNSFVKKFANGILFSESKDLTSFFSDYQYFKSNAEIIKGSFEHTAIILELYKFYKQ